MPRTARQFSNLGFYHVMVRGNGKQILFECDDDRTRYLTKLYFCFKDEGLVLHAWCLMDNHAHLLVYDEVGALPAAMARINGSYAQHYNKKYGHVGHVFQDRYRCKPVESERQLLEVVRYIHNNPEDALICKLEDYRWSSYQEFLGSPRLVDTSVVLGILGGRVNFKRFSHERSDPALRLGFESNPSTETLVSIARDVLLSVEPSDVSALPRRERNLCLQALRETGFTYKQIERLTGIAKGTVMYAISSLEDDDEP